MDEEIIFRNTGEQPSSKVAALRLPITGFPAESEEMVVFDPACLSTVSDLCCSETINMKDLQVLRKNSLFFGYFPFSLNLERKFKLINSVQQGDIRVELVSVEDYQKIGRKETLETVMLGRRSVRSLRVDTLYSFRKMYADGKEIWLQLIEYRKRALLVFQEKLYLIREQDPDPLVEVDLRLPGEGEIRVLFLRTDPSSQTLLAYCRDADSERESIRRIGCVGGTDLQDPRGPQRAEVMLAFPFPPDYKNSYRHLWYGLSEKLYIEGEYRDKVHIFCRKWVNWDRVGNVRIDSRGQIWILEKRAKKCRPERRLLVLAPDFSLLFQGKAVLICASSTNQNDTLFQGKAVLICASSTNQNDTLFQGRGLIPKDSFLRLDTEGEVCLRLADGNERGKESVYKLRLEKEE